MSTNPYLNLVSETARYAREGRTYPLGGFPPAPRPDLPPDAPKVLVFSPHPDDECILGALPLRFLRQSRMNVINVAVTQGSNKARQAGRLAELQGACRYLGFGLVQTQPNGLEKVSAKTRAQDPAAWAPMVARIAEIIAEHQPRVVCCPHDGDWNSTHVGTHHLVVDALASLPPAFSCNLVESEFWGQMADPNLTVESSIEDVSDLVTATSFHVEEVRRNPYHLLLPAWMQDNVRRGGEVVGGQGGTPPSFEFATLYRLCRWDGRALQPAYDGGRVLSAAEDAGNLFGAF